MVVSCKKLWHTFLRQEERAENGRQHSLLVA